jgi:hypothetical protein
VHEALKGIRLKVDDPIERGDQYDWIPLDGETEAVLSFYVGKRDGQTAYEFIGDLSGLHYAFDLGNGGWQARLLGIFGRTLGPNLGRGPRRETNPSD